MSEIRTKDVWPEAMEQVRQLSITRIPRRTSTEAFKRITESGLLSSRRLEVYQMLFHWGPCTASELSAHIRNMTRNHVSARLTELVDHGVAREVRTRKCQVTGMRVIEFDVTGNMPVKPEKKKSALRIAMERIMELERENADLRGML